MDIDFSKPKQVSVSEVYTADDIETVTGVNQSSDDMGLLFEN